MRAVVETKIYSKKKLLAPPCILSMVIFCGEQALLERTGYTLDVTTGQRKYGGPPPESAHSGAQPTIGTEV